MKCSASVRSFVAATIVLSAPLLAQDKDWKKSLEEDLERTTYKKSSVAKFEINNVTEAGTILVVQKEGVVADRSHSFGTFVTKIKDGTPIAPGGAGGFFSRSSSRILKKGDRVYLYDVEIKDDAILLNLLSSEMFDVTNNGKTEHTRLKASVRFEFDRAGLPKATGAELKRMFDTVLLPEDEATAAKTVELDQTTDQVESTLGKPEKLVRLGDKVIWIYKDMKVVFVGGKVSDVQ